MPTLRRLLHIVRPLQMRWASIRTSERGMALVTGLLVLLLASSLLAGFLTVVTADSKLRGVDKARTQSFYAAYAGLEKLTADLGNLFVSDYSPEAEELTALQDEPPFIKDVQFIAQDGLGYTITWKPDANGDPASVTKQIPSGPFEGLRGLITSYTITTTARTADGAESRMVRDVNTVGIPVFQFGIFSETDVTFSANETFSFGGRVHSNGFLWLTAASGGTTTLADRVTVVREVVRTHLANGRLNDGTHEGTVRVVRSPGSYRTLTESEGSVVGNYNSALNSNWTTLSIGTYNGNIRNTRTGAKRLDLPFVNLGAKPIDLIKRPVLSENPLITDQRLFTLASVRILLSDNANEITDLPGVSAGTVPLTVGAFNGHPLGQTADPSIGWGYRAPLDTPINGGHLKVEYRNAAGNWIDVTTEWLNLGFSKRNIDEMTSGNAIECLHDPGTTTHPSSTTELSRAILRIQRIRHQPTTHTPCGARVTPLGTDSTNGRGVPTPQARDYWPLTLYDVREAWSRDNLADGATSLYLGGVIHYIELDVNNLKRWLAGMIGASGTNAVNEDGYAIYFSDRRNNKNLSNKETGEYGSEDMINPGDTSAAPNGILDAGEDVNDNGVLDTYGATARTPVGGWGGWAAPFNSTAHRRTLLTSCTTTGCTDTAMNKARVNPAVMFRRALKLVNGTLGNLPSSGLTIASENPVYVEGHYNANDAGFGTGAAAAIMADSITLLSDNWRLARLTDSGWFAHGDTRTFNDPNDPGSRPAANTRYRFAALAGKIKAFPQLNTPASYGTDGGVHNFLRLTESWSDATLYYLGSLASFFHSRQNVGLFRCCTNVYQLPARSFQFDSNFLIPSMLPPKTPMFRDVNTTRFRQITREQ